MPLSLNKAEHQRPIVISCGEPAGIGPECAAKAWKALKEEEVFAVIGDAKHFEHLCPIQEIESLSEASSVMKEALPLMPLEFGTASTPGTPNPEHAAPIIEAIRWGHELATNGEAAALCTLPIHKAALAEGAEFGFPGHTEFLGALSNVETPVMMIAGSELKVVPATIHIALSQVPQKLTPRHLSHVIRTTHEALRELFGIKKPNIAVSGLNPHAGEEGRMGSEELEWISPLLQELRQNGMRLIGPLPADTMFHAEARANYDAAVCMYHDQALIPAKTLDFSGSVNVTLGLPIIRTSPDHGTAFNIAGLDKANPSSTIAALRLARKMATSQMTKRNVT